MSRESFKKALDGARQGNWVPVQDIVRRDPEMAAMVSKLNTAPHTTSAKTNTDQNQTLPDMSRLRTLSDNTATNIIDNETITDVLPDMQLAQEILISAVLAPKDMMTTELTYKGGDGIVSADVASALTAEIKEHFDLNYKIESQLPEILRDIFFRTGSYVYAVIPENSVDQLINGTGKITMEGLQESINKDGTIKPRHLLGPAVKAAPKEINPRAGISLEAFGDFDAQREIDPRIQLDRNTNSPLDTYISVFDNPDLVKIPDLQRRLREQRISQLVGAGQALSKATNTSNYAAEAFGAITEREIASQIFKNPQYAYKPMVRVHTQSQLARRAIGNPLVLHLPSESVMPVHVPGKPEEHIGYFVLLDGDGNPISKTNRDDQYRQLSSRFNTGDNFASTMLKKVRNQMEGDFNQYNHSHLDISSRVFGELIEQELMMRLNNGVYAGGVAMAKQEEIYRIMLARALAKQHTQLLFMPVELTTYMAIRYNDDGIGESILEKMKTLNSLRVMTMFANTAASMKNSIGRTKVNLKFDEDDPDPEKSFEIMKHEFMRTRQGVLPVGLTTPADITDWMAKASYEFTTEGNPMLPDVKIDVQQASDSYIKPDQDLEEMLRKKSIMALGVSPEQVDASYNAEFATVANNNNLMLSKRALQHQEQITPFLTEHHRKVIRNTEGLLSKLATIIENNIEKIKPDWLKSTTGTEIDFSSEAGAKQKPFIIAEVLEQFLRSFEVTLPAPNTASLTNQLSALEEYAKGLDAALDAWLPQDGLTDTTTGEINQEFQMLKAQVKAHFMRKFMAENGILPELAELTMKDDTGKPMVDLYQAVKDHTQAVAASLTGLLKSFVPQKDLSNQTVEDIGGVSGGGGGGTDDTSGGDGGEGGGDGFDDFSLGGDGNDNPLEAAPDNTAPVEGEEEPPADTTAAQSGGDETGKGADEQNQS